MDKTSEANSTSGGGSPTNGSVGLSGSPVSTIDQSVPAKRRHVRSTSNLPSLGSTDFGPAFTRSPPSTPHSTFNRLSSTGPRQRSNAVRSISHASLLPVKSSKPPQRSTRLTGEIAKPWLEVRDKSRRWGYAFFYGAIFLGIAGSAAFIYFSYAALPRLGNLCLVMDDDFSNGINPEYWSHEVRVDGFGNHEFEWTTTESRNSRVEDGVLYITPTLTADQLGYDAILNGATVNLTLDGTCTSANVSQCAVVSNITKQEIITPIQSARLNTKGKVSIKYGKVEVQARMPVGDWLWPAIWMLPSNNTYGEWPMSGEIDIAESRGNSPVYTGFGNDYYMSALHWGPLTPFDTWWKTWGQRRDKIKGFTKGYRTYGIEWDEKFISLYLDNRVTTTFELKFKDEQTFWKLGNYPSFWINSTGQTNGLPNPWISAQNNGAPFDQSFYLILNLAVGGTNGFFPDNLGSKPWSDTSATAMSDFWAARDKWLPTWPTDASQRSLAVKSVKMWQKC